jgi:KaiC/GvpD/RAD55 family RecA-like ATPase
MAEQDVERCEFCRQAIVAGVVTADHDGQTYRLCSESCRDCLVSGDYVFTDSRDGRRFRPGVKAVDDALPEGMSRNSFVLVSGMAGTRTEAVLAEVAWRTLRRGEPVVVVTFTEPPESLVDSFFALDWNVTPYLDSGKLRLVDAFTDRMDDSGRMYDRMSRWSRHVRKIAAGATTTVRDPSDTSELANKLDDQLQATDAVGEGVVVVDSLTEFGSLVQPVKAYGLVKDLRADVCKGRYVSLFAGATYGSDLDEFPHDLQYAVDGVVQLQQTDELLEDTLVKRARVRKMRGVVSVAEWTAYEYTGGVGMLTYDPREVAAEAAEGEGDGDQRQVTEDPDDDRTGPAAVGNGTPDGEGGVDPTENLDGDA